MTDQTNLVATCMMVIGALMIIAASSANANISKSDLELVAPLEKKLIAKNATINQLLKREAALLLELEQMRSQAE